MLKVENLSKIYDGGTQALDDVSFEVEPGEFLAIIGLSGSGKSTLLRCINRLIEPTSGTITWDGVDVTKASQEELRRIRRRIGMVFQHFNLVNRSQVLTNVLSGRLGYLNPALSVVNRFPKADIDKAHAQLARVGLEEKWNARADELSGGQKQRVGVARASRLQASTLCLLAASCSTSNGSTRRMAPWCCAPFTSSTSSTSTRTGSSL
jgi:phosphonate transport system ATP-binding protein